MSVRATCRPSVRPIVSPLARNGVSGTTDLVLPTTFPVTLQRNAGRYLVKESAASFQTGYTSGTIYVSESGDDTTGDGTEGNPYLTVTKAHTEASNGYTIVLEPGVYPSFTITKNVFITCPDGLAYIGVFNDWTTAQIDVTSSVLWNVDDLVAGQTFMGYVRRDGILVSDMRGTCRAIDLTAALAYQNTHGAMCAQTGSVSANFSTGTSETIPELVAAGAILAYTDASTTGVVLGGTTRMKNIVIANYSSSGALSISGSANIVLDHCEVYGGFTSGTISAETAGATLVMFDCRGTGAPNDIVDYRSNVIGVEINCKFKWAYGGASDNVSTAHDNASVLRVGGLYAGGSRTIHDIASVESYIFSCEIRDALSGDATLLLAGTSTDTTQMTYGDITFAGSYTATTSFVGTATITVVDLDDAWPYT